MRTLIYLLLTIGILIQYSHNVYSQNQDMLITEGNSRIEGSLEVNGSEQIASSTMSISNSAPKRKIRFYKITNQDGSKEWCIEVSTNIENLGDEDLSQSPEHSSWKTSTLITEDYKDLYDISYSAPNQDVINWESRFHIDAYGNTGIGINDLSQKLTVNGNILTYGSVINASDSRLKDNITPLQNALDKIKKLNGVTYKYKAGVGNFEFDNNNQIGFVAQEVKKYFPELVHEDNNGYLAVNYQSLIPVLVESIKTLSDENEIFKTTILDLENRIKSLE